MDAKQAVKQIVEYLGGKGNIVTVTNCMTRLRVVVRDDAQVDADGMKQMVEVLGLVHDRPCSYEVVVGPGKSRKYADLCHDMGLEAAASVIGEDMDWQKNKAAMKAGQKENKLKSALKVIGDIFVPLIPGVIAAGLCAGFSSLITQLIPNYADIPAWNIINTLLTLIKDSFMTYITAWAGYRAAERFGATPILGGMLGLLTSLGGIDSIAKTLGLYNEQAPLESILRSGKGGVLAVIIGVLILSFVEKKIRKHMPDSLDIVFTPLLSLLIVCIPYILIVMPVFGYVSSGIAWVFGKACMSTSVIVRIITGYVASALFLPLVAAGMHHGMVALYSVQLQELGFITLYPALAMAGAGQVGASIAIMQRAKKLNNQRLTSVIRGALPAGFLGVGEPLIYGVTLPMGKPFIMAGLGAGFGGAFTMLMQVASTTWGPSGLLGIFVMTAGPKGPLVSIACYLIGLAISYVMSYVITKAALKDEDVMPQDAVAVPANAADTNEPDQANAGLPGDAAAKGSGFVPGSHKTVKHGELISLGDGAADDSGCSAAGETKAADAAGGPTEFRFIITDPLGIHARPAGEIAKIIKRYDCHFTIEAGNKKAIDGSVIQMLSLGAAKGTELYCHAEGPEAPQAIDAVRKYLKKEH